MLEPGRLPIKEKALKKDCSRELGVRLEGCGMFTQSKRLWVWVVVSSIWLGLGFGGPWAAAGESIRPSTSNAFERPNFVFFMTDDQRADKLSIAGDPMLKTPNIDRIAREGVWFKNAFVVNSLCTPSRASFLTGKYGHTTGVRENAQGKNKLPVAERTFPERLKDAGYEIAFIGKSHIDGNLRDRPWDYYFGFRGQGDYLDPKIAENKGPDLQRAGLRRRPLGPKGGRVLEQTPRKALLPSALVQSPSSTLDASAPISALV